MSNVLGKLKPIVDETILKLSKPNFRKDPIGGKFGFITSVISSAYKRHGAILEQTIVERLKECKHLEIFIEDKFPISSRASMLASQSGNDLDITSGTNLPFETRSPARVLQIDCIVYNKRKRSISSYEIKRGNGAFDAGKKRSIRNDLLSTNFLLKNYGKSKKIKVNKSYSYIICYYGLRALPIPFSLVKEDLDSHFGASIIKEVEQVNNYFKNSLHNMIDNKIK
tara:strand:+ start:1675 stop:2349 length:675 start_codon:yes stop_codon:yes gene_type:complete